MGLPPNPLNPAVPLWGSILTGIPAAVPHSNALLALLRDGVVKRRTYFSFHFEDVWRVNIVRNAWKIRHRDAQYARSFYDSSIWETRKLSDDEAVKRLIREGVQNTSAICVLVGAGTWVRRWVRYEIARAIIDQRGLLAVHINSICNSNGLQEPLGHNPLSYMGIYKEQSSLYQAPRYYIYEFKDGHWQQYQDYVLPVELPPYLPDPAPNYISWLSAGAALYDYIGGDGHRNIGTWVDTAAKQAHR